MTYTESSAGSIDWTKRTWGYIACQNCGKPVHVLLPFIGCVFCSKCSQPSGWSAEANAEEFKNPYRVEVIE